MTERPAAPAETDDIERHPDYLPEPDFFDEDDVPEDQPPEPAEDDDSDA
jgi:hypothetical protein